MNIKAMGYPAKNYHFNTESETKSIAQGKEHKGIKGEAGGIVPLKTMYGTKKTIQSKRKM